MSEIYTEENGAYRIDCSKAKWSTDRIHDIYHQQGLYILKDVDFVIETDDCLLLVEYKNARIDEAAAPGSFDPLEENTFRSLVRKFYDSLHYLHLMGKTKTTQYVCVIEYPRGNAVTRRRLRNRLKNRLPFRLQEACRAEKALINRVAVLDISEWNKDPLYHDFPILPASPQQ